MPATVIRLRTKRDQLQAEQAEHLRQLVLSLPKLPERAVGEIIAAIDRSTAAEHGWTFVMVSPEDNAKVVAWLSENSAKPMLAMRLWSVLFLHLRRDTGEIAQTRDELAAAVGTQADEVSRIMGELEGIGAITRERVKVAGMRGPGVVRYRMNQCIATHLTGVARNRAQADAPLLKLVETPGS